MPFQIHALPADYYAPLRLLSDSALARRHIHRMSVDAENAFPCRVSLRDAAIGETVLLLNHVSVPQDTPYAAAHAIFVREGAQTAMPAPSEVPEALARRLLSIRGFDSDHMIQDADVIDGRGLAGALEAMLSDHRITQVHVHHAKRGCFAARVTRA